MSKEKRVTKKIPCGRCNEECITSTSLPCGFCETHFHVKCVDGMTDEFLDSCDKMNKLFGGSAFLCTICRKLAGKINKTFNDVDVKMAAIEKRLKIVELERDSLAEKVARMDTQAVQVSEGMVKIEKEIEAGMEIAKEKAKDEMTSEMKEIKEKSTNIVLYGLEESKEGDAAKRMEEDMEKVKKVAQEIDVTLKGAIEVKFRAGKKTEENSKPRPLIFKIEDDETRELMLTNARKLARKEEYKRVFISPDMTYRQREDARKEEKKLREEAETKTEESKNEGRAGGKYVVVGQRGRRRIIWVTERRE